MDGGVLAFEGLQSISFFSEGVRGLGNVVKWEKETRGEGGTGPCW